jgi:hypothetical protein
MKRKGERMAKKNTKKVEDTQNYLDLLYMTPKVITAKDIKEALKEKAGILIEFWEEMNVLEIGLSDGNTIDFEAISTEFKNPSDLAFIKNRNIQTIFYIRGQENSIEEIKACFQSIINQLGGFLCTDSDDFKPFYVGL